MLRHVLAWKRWLKWDNTRWRIEETQYVVDLARDVCREFSKNLTTPEMATRTWVTAVEGLAQSDRRHAVLRGEIFEC